MTIQINETLRIVDRDANQYVLERRGPKPNDDGKYHWQSIAFCGSPAAVVLAVERELISEAQEAAKLETLRQWSLNPANIKCMDLPKKDGK